MASVNKVSMVVLVGVLATTLTAPTAQARDGHNAALIGGVLLGAVAGVAIANSSDDGYRYAQPRRQVYYPEYSAPRSYYYGGYGRDYYHGYATGYYHGYRDGYEEGGDED
jgi:hypothetical protein